MTLTFPQLNTLMPGAGPSLVLDFLDPLNAALEKWEINTPRRTRYFLATLAVESGELVWMRERASGADYDGREDLGNTEPEARRIAAAHGSTPGPWWPGRGPMQITGYKNHLLCGNALGLDLLNQPELLEQPGPGCLSAGWFWKIGAGLNLGRRAIAHGVQVGCDLNELADREDALGIRLAVNGGTNGFPQFQRYAETFAALIPHNVA